MFTAKWQVSIIASVLLALTSGPLRADDAPSFGPATFGLPDGNKITSKADVQRVYKTDKNNKILAKQPKGYPKTVSADYEKKKNEFVRPHGGVDLSTRDADGKRGPLPFKAGVYGEVVGKLGGKYGTISVKLADGSGKVVQYLHTSKQNVKVGDKVTPDTILGNTGKKGANAYHLHVQVRDSSGTVMKNPVAAIQSGYQPPRGKTPAVPQDTTKVVPVTKPKGVLMRIGVDPNTIKREQAKPDLKKKILDGK